MVGVGGKVGGGPVCRGTRAPGPRPPGESSHHAEGGATASPPRPTQLGRAAGLYTLPLFSTPALPLGRVGGGDPTGRK